MVCNCDVLVVGAGVVGCAVARELARYKLNVAVAEKNNDLFGGTSARNSGVLHAGFNNTPGTLMAKLCVEGNAGFDKVAEELDIPLKRTGKIVVGFDEEDRKRLIALKEQGEKNGVPGLSMIDHDEVKKLAPCVEGEFALFSASTAILDPFQYVLALAENAVKNGVEFFFSHPVTAIEKLSGEEANWSVTFGEDTMRCRWIVNAAGLFADKISDMLGKTGYTIYPCRGEYFILDKRLGDMLPLPAYPVPNIRTGGLGIHLTPTSDGNVLIGPSTEYIDDRGDYSATRKTMDMLVEDGSRIFPHIRREHYIRNFSGIRPKLTGPDKGGYNDFVIEPLENAVNLVGIESPGLTASVPIARMVVNMIGEKEKLVENPDFDPIRRRFATFHDKDTQTRAEMIEKDPNYGEIICRCETITKAEILNAIRGPLGAKTVTGVKYRCRSTMGRCQGGYCQTRITEMLMSELGLTREEVLYAQEGSNMFTGRVIDDEDNQ
ncbi:MAG: NAD(P)/FAD-dependent oxidoreductase [Ruminococcaceae bacterium]|nr:NAD(P)/FAD-dependent oxidoreductase [Oscillospiraceae bacterium]